MAEEAIDKKVELTDAERITKGREEVMAVLDKYHLRLDTVLGVNPVEPTP